MPEKSRQRRVKVAAREGRATAIKSSDVGKASGLSSHAAKKSAHVEGLRTTAAGKRNVGRRKAPHEGEGTAAPEVSARKEASRTAAANRQRTEQKVISRRTPLAAKTVRAGTGATKHSRASKVSRTRSKAT